MSSSSNYSKDFEFDIVRDNSEKLGFWASFLITSELLVDKFEVKVSDHVDDHGLDGMISKELSKAVSLSMGERSERHFVTDSATRSL